MEEGEREGEDEGEKEGSVREGVGERIGEGEVAVGIFSSPRRHNFASCCVQQYVCPNTIRRDTARPSLPIVLSISSNRQCFRTLLCVGAVPPPSLTLWLVKTNSVYLVARYVKFTR